MDDPSILVVAPLLSIVGFSWLLVKRFKISPYIAPLCAMGSLVAILYLSDFLLLMRLSSLGGLVVGLGFFVCYAWGLLRDSRDLSRRHVLLISIATIGVACLYDLNRHAALNSWDEFSHWGTIVKITSIEHTFHLKDKLITFYFQDYPPGTALLAYFFLRVTNYSEPVLFFSYSMILVAASLPAIGLALSVSYLRGALAIIGSYLLVTTLGQGWSSVLIDQIVGILFGAILCSYLLMRHQSAKQQLCLIPLLCFLVLSKQSGSSFFLVVIALIALDKIWLQLARKKNERQWLGLWPIVALWAIPQLINSSWYHYVRSAGLKQSFTAISLKDALTNTLIKCCGTDRELTAMSNFFRELVGTPDALPASPASFFHVVREQLFRPELTKFIFTHGHIKIVLILAIVLALAVSLHKRSEKTGLAIMSAGLIVAGAAYCLMLLTYYLYMFSDYEGRVVISMTRYLNTYELGVAFVAMGLSLSTPLANARQKTWETSIAMFLLLCLAIFYKPKSNSYLLNGASTISPQRSQIRQMLQPMMRAAAANSNIYVIWQGTNGFEFWMTHYEVRPRNTNFDCFSLGPPQYKDDMHSCNLSEAELNKTFSSFDYVFVGRGLSGLEKIYPTLFRSSDTRDSGYFAVIKNAEGAVYLRSIQSTAN